MKWYWFLAIAGVVLWIFKPAAKAFWNPFDWGTPETPEQKTANEANKNWPGGSGDPSKIHLADQTLYPGYYQNEYGGFYNPTTGASYSPGSSPVVVGPSYYDLHPDQVPVVNMNVPKVQPGAGAEIPGYNMVY